MTMAASQSGTSELTSRMGRGVSSQTRWRTAIVVRARYGGRPVQGAYSSAPQAGQVAAVIERLAACLFRRHVQRGAGHGAALRQAGTSSAAAGQAEVGEPGAAGAAVEEDVGGLDVPVNQSLGVSRSQAARPPGQPTPSTSVRPSTPHWRITALPG